MIMVRWWWFWCEDDDNNNHGDVKLLSLYHTSHTSYWTCVCMYDGWCI